ncbi:Gfo/Idh/MocA family protein [Thalassoroseus pseudoceratinae]|uniref:Gfo/Idh/MocA family protein n=1 Tax=Thalassoroseus pseudoceratinae TaxID=2713176 RepID=UPI001423537C|nr:Gfo/Idh/MocA family oxidoreductase [Thalassoroseus pseudoceratinae]
MNRREMLTNTGKVAAAGAVLAASAPHAFAGEDDTIQIALVGCGGRGTGAAANALSVQNGSIKLVAMADVFGDRLKPSHKTLTTSFPDRCDVPEGRQFLGFDGYKNAMDCLRPGDVVILTTPPAFRWVMYKYAIEKGLNVFMEKPVTVDGPSTRKILALNEKAKEKDLKVGVGLMCRHCEIRGELFNRIQDGEIGDVLFLRAYRMLGPVASAFSKAKPDGMNELEYQIRRFHSFLWASGGAYSDFLIHNIDECCWMKNAWPVEAKASGGRHYRDDYVDQNFDTYSVEYTFEDGTKLFLNGRNMVGCHNEFASYAHGSKGSAVISASSHSPARSRIYEGQKFDRSKITWQGPRREPNPYQLEWNNLIAAIRENKHYNEVERGAKASLVTSMGRMAAHTGRVITFDEMLNCEHEFAPTVDQLTMSSPAPVQAGPDGTYPVPMPGLETKREYA